MKKKNLIVLLFISIFYSCKKEISTVVSPAPTSVTGQAIKASPAQSRKIYVSTVEELYAAINDPENAGGTLVLKPGTYTLNASYPNGGRLELLNDMALLGQEGDPGQVIIDITSLPASSFTIAGTNNRTGAVRTGDGQNSIEWITFQNNPAHVVRSMIQTDIVTTMISKIKVAHCVIKGSSIGLSILNRDSPANGRLLEADVEDNEIMNNTVLPFGSGIQIQNTTLENGVLKVKLSRNYIHDNKAGMLIFNSSSRQCGLEVKSYDDLIENNGIGAVLNGGFILLSAFPTLDNTLDFDAYGSTIKNNAGIPAPPYVFPSTGIRIVGGQSMPPFDLPGSTHNNRINVSLYGCIVAGNGSTTDQIYAYGAHSFYPTPVPAGTDNVANLYLNGISRNISVHSENSVPFEAAGTNIVNVNR